MKEFYETNKDKYIKILKLGKSSSEADKIHEFLIYSPREVLRVVLECKSLKMYIKFRRYLRIEKDLEIKHFAEQRLLLVPDDHFLEMWDESLSYKVHSFELELKIKFFILIPSRDSLIVGDKNR